MKRSIYYLLVFSVIFSLNMKRVMAEEITINKVKNDSEINTLQKESTSARDRYEEIIEESGDVIPGAPGILDDETSVTTILTQDIDILTEQTILWEESFESNQTLVFSAPPLVTSPHSYNQITPEPRREVNQISADVLKNIIKYRKQSITLAMLVLVPSDQMKYIEVRFLPVWKQIMMTLMRSWQVNYD